MVQPLRHPVLPLHALRERIAREEEAQDEVNKEKKQVNKRKSRGEQQSVGDTFVCGGVKGERAQREEEC